MSYMDRKNILKEGLIDKIITKLITKPILRRSTKFMSMVGDLNDAIEELEKAANAELKKDNPKAKKIKINKYRI